MIPFGLAITEAQFKQFYGDVVSYDLFTSEPTSDDDLFNNYLTSKLWRLNNLYTIIDKDGQRIPFKMNYAQHKVYAASLEHPRLIILKSRQQGISTFWLLNYLDDALIQPDLNIGLMAQGKSEASTLLERVKLAWETFPEDLKQLLELRLLRNNSEEYAFSTNAKVFIRVSFRSATLHRLHISEYGKIAKTRPDRAQETKTGTLQAIKPGNPVVIESTAEGDNDFKAMWDKAIEAEARVQRLGLPCFAGKDFKPVFLSWLDDPDCVSDHLEEPNQNELEYFETLEAELNIIITQEQRNFWVAQYRELGDVIYQEYPATPTEAFTKVKDGCYYSKAFHKHVINQGRVLSGLYDPNLDVHVMMDLGVDDTFVLVYFQVWRNEWRIIDEYFNDGEGLAFYVSQIESTGYPIGTVYGPHDLNVRELGTGKTRKQRLLELGVQKLRVLPKKDIADGIEQVRKIIPNLYIDEKCTYIIGCFKNYSREWDDKYEVWKNQPRHDKWSHGADTVRGIAMSGVVPVPSKTTRPKPKLGGRPVVDGIAL